MCLAMPGKILSIEDPDSVSRMGRVSFGGVIKRINLAFVPDAAVGDYVIVHAGIAINKLDTAVADEFFQTINEIYEVR
jgi:hydrogenase expression/formation protein HypC